MAFNTQLLAPFIHQKYILYLIGTMILINSTQYYFIRNLNFWKRPSEYFVNIEDHLFSQTLSSSKLHKNDLGPLPAALTINYASFLGFIYFKLYLLF